MRRITLALALSLGLLTLAQGTSLAQVDEPPPPPPLGDVDEPPPPPPPRQQSGTSTAPASKPAAAAPVDEDSPVVRPSGEGGNMGLFFRFGGLATMATTGDSVKANSNALNAQIGLKFVFNENMMLPVFFGTSVRVATVNPASGDPDSSNNFSMDLGTGMEYHFRIWRRLSPFAGGLLKLGFYDPTGDDNLVFRFHIGGVIGVEYFIGDRISLAAAYQLMFSVVHTTTSSDSSKTDFDMTTKNGMDPATAVGADSGGNITLCFYF